MQADDAVLYMSRLAHHCHVTPQGGKYAVVGGSKLDGGSIFTAIAATRRRGGVNAEHHSSCLSHPCLSISRRVEGHRSIGRVHNDTRARLQQGGALLHKLQLQCSLFLVFGRLEQALPLLCLVPPPNGHLHFDDQVHFRPHLSTLLGKHREGREHAEKVTIIRKEARLGREAEHAVRKFFVCDLVIARHVDGVEYIIDGVLVRSRLSQRTLKFGSLNGAISIQIEYGKELFQCLLAPHTEVLLHKATRLVQSGHHVLRWLTCISRCTSLLRGRSTFPTSGTPFLPS
mmetsp:Transcript_25554/g.64093  ORF Transcript_25554/g.64093 Transcript_25554/m.64093 type:complete len:286 (-) Transcript_25554:204-1061(-)